MKKIFVSIAALLCTALLIFISCEKEKEKKNICPIVEASSVPATIISVFSEKYPNEKVTTWFNKDNVGYCAYFISGNIKKLAKFSNDGTFISEETEGNHEDNGIDNADDSTDNDGIDNADDDTDNEHEGCDCDID